MELTWNKSQHTKLTLEKKIVPLLLLGLELKKESVALSSKLSWLPTVHCGTYLVKAVTQNMAQVTFSLFLGNMGLRKP